jgi:glyoxylase-like metal-dependent hydrolase (beta-lactamase superfamily II)
MGLLHQIETLVVGPLETNCYLLASPDTHECAVIDPGGDEEAIENAIARRQWRPTMILLTHAHFDHAGAVAALKRRFDAPVGTSVAEAQCLGDPRRSGAEFFGFPYEPSEADFIVDDGDELWVGREAIEALSTPGHSAGGLSFRCGHDLFVGDALFCGGIGRYDLPGSNREALRRSLKRLLQFDDPTKIYPGHGPPTTIGRERLTNPELRAMGLTEADDREH